MTLLQLLGDPFFDALKDSFKLLPYLFGVYCVTELLEQRYREKTVALIQKSGRFGPFIGAVLGIFPQCGFSAAAANLYACGYLTKGTLTAVFLSTSDEMLPVMLSAGVRLTFILQILLVKLFCGVVSGFLVDGFFTTSKDKESAEPAQNRCSCTHLGILQSAFLHTARIFVFVAAALFCVNTAFLLLGVETVTGILQQNSLIGILLSALVGLIPNCASSVIITELFLKGGISPGAMIAGLLTNSGVGAMILFRVNHNRRDSIAVIGTVFVFGIVFGVVFEVLPVLNFL